MKSPRKLSLAAIGCGGRTRTYLELAAGLPEFEIVAAADPVEERVQLTAALSQNPNFRMFASDRELLSEPRLADIMIIGTQDHFHVDPCIAAMEKGYDILLEKPIATSMPEVLRLDRQARELGRRVLVCHVLRYTPFYTKVKEIVDSGLLGEVITVHASEGVGPWHQAHSYVRGHWAVTEKATPMIVAKSCHDMDILSWIFDRPCKSVASFGGIAYFHSGKAPDGAPARCTDGCPVASTCPYDAHLYLSQHRKWITYVHPDPLASDAAILEWLRHNPWGRCVYRCDNTAVDHQVVALEFEGRGTATFTMTAFDDGRNIEIMGTKGVLRGGHLLRHQLGCDLLIQSHHGSGGERILLDESVGGYDGHGGGDVGLVRALFHEMTVPTPAEMRSSLPRSVQSHRMAFAAEESRRSGQQVWI